VSAANLRIRGGNRDICDLWKREPPGAYWGGGSPTQLSPDNRFFWPDPASGGHIRDGGLTSQDIG
jgi:hypothetical protein